MLTARFVRIEQEIEREQTVHKAVRMKVITNQGCTFDSNIIDFDSVIDFFALAST